MQSPIKRARLSPIKSPQKLGIPIPSMDFSSPLKSEIDQDIDPSLIPTLPLSGSIPRITGKTLCDMLNGLYDECFESLFIVDCRYNYEYEGGHIKGAQNINSPEELASCFFKEIISNATFVFHCEFSQNRGPQMASIFRNIDREENKERYPFLYYPNVYILDGGYRRFYSEYPDFCDGGYVTMLDENHKNNGDLVRSTTMFRENVDRLNRQKRDALQWDAIKSDANQFQSPVLSISTPLKSPMTAKMFTYLASPLFHK